jgi:hypothetical protein
VVQADAWPYWTGFWRTFTPIRNQPVEIPVTAPLTTTEHSVIHAMGRTKADKAGLSSRVARLLHASSSQRLLRDLAAERLSILAGAW